MLASSGEAMPPWGVPVFVSLIAPSVGHDARLQECLDQGENTLISDASAHPIQKSRVPDVVEARFDVRVQHPVVALGAEVVDLGDRVMSPTLRAEAVADRLEVRLEDRFQDQHE